MSFNEKPIYKRATRRHKAQRCSPSSPFSPLPELREFVPQRQAAEESQRPAKEVGEDAVEMAKTPPTHLQSRQGRRTRSRTRKSGSRHASNEGSQPPAQRLKRRRRRIRRSCLLLSLLLLCTLSGFLATGLYLTEAHILAPLAGFFRPINGNTTGSINGRAWNLLLLGSDNDRKFVFPGLLTQVMMVVRVNPLAGRVSLVSIPRDSWVSVPGEGMHKIDQAFFLGASPHHNFDDGVRLARATIEQDYGVHIDRYAWVGLDGFSSIIDTLGGVDIDITHPIVDDNYPDDTNWGGRTNPYAVKRLYLPPGMQHLNGEQALEYVRSRHADLVGDIGRTQRQQEVLQALKKKLDITNIFSHLSELFHDLAGKVYTDLSQSELLSVANFGRDLRAEAIQKLTLGPGQGNQNYGTLTRTTDPSLDQSQDIILPNCATIQSVVNRIFDLGDTASCKANGSG